MTAIGRWGAHAGAAGWLCIMLAACGGGGGGDGAAEQVTVGPASPAAVQVHTLQGQAMPNQQVSGSVSGNVHSLQGRTIYVVVEDPASLFESSAQAVVENTAAGYRYTLYLQGRTLAQAGHFTGQLRLHACLDAQCSQHLAGTPFAVPFDVNVEAGLTLDRKHVEVSVPFGTVPADEPINVSLSGYSSGWVANNNTPYNPSVPTRVEVRPQAGALLPPGQMTLHFAPAKPGTYNETVRVNTVATLPDRREISFEETVEITYTVTPNPALDHVFSPQQLALTIAYGDPLIHESGYELVTNTGVTATWQGIDFLTHPSGVAMTGPFDRWWSEYPYKAAYACTVSFGSGGVRVNDCMPPGEYSAQVRYQLDGPGGSRVVAMPIKLTVTP